MLQGGVDGNHENCILWYYKAKHGFVECSGQRKITEWLVAKESGDKGKAPKLKKIVGEGEGGGEGGGGGSRDGLSGGDSGGCGGHGGGHGSVAIDGRRGPIA